MLRNYLTIAYRNLLRYKLFSLINILGLALGMMACLLILQYVHFELSYDNFHPGAANIYRITSERYTANQLVDKSAITFGALGSEMSADFPQVRSYTRLHKRQSSILAFEQVMLTIDKAYLADANCLTLFGYQMLKGNKQTALEKPNSIVLSASTARKFFGDKNPVGQIMLSNGGAENEMSSALFTVTGVFEDQPAHTHLKTDCLLSFSSVNNTARWGGNYMNNYPVYTYVLLAPQANTVDLKQNLQDKYGKTDRSDSKLSFQPLQDIHLDEGFKNEPEISGGNRNIVYFLSLIAGFILLIAYINYINISTAKAVERAREVGIRKINGASRKNLLVQFLIESALLNIAALMLALSFLQIALPYVRQLNNQPDPSGYPTLLWAVLIVCFAIGTVLSGLYPAWVLSAFNPVKVLKGTNIRSPGGAWLRKGLVVFQFTVSVIFIIGTFVVQQQITFMQERDLGMQIDQILVIERPNIIDTNDSIVARNYDFFKNSVLQYPNILHVAGSTNIPGRGLNTNVGDIRQVADKSTVNRAVGFFFADTAFFPAYGLQFIAGRNFRLSDNFPDQYGNNKGAIINETAVRSLGFNSPEEAIGQEIFTVPTPRKTPIIGVVKDFHQQSLKSLLNPLVIQYDPAAGPYLSVQVRPANIRQSISLIQDQWKKLFPGIPFTYIFLDDFFNAQYQSDLKFGKVFNAFAFLAVFIACLGLFGLVSFTTFKRTKEIGVRKVLGASVVHILTLLNKDFIRLLLLSNVIAWPIAYLAAKEWLQNYAFRIDMSPWLFVVPSILVLVIAILAISVQTIKAARANPVKSLRYE